MKTLVYFFDGMADFEISLLLQLLISECKKELEIVSDKPGIVTSASGLQFNVTKTLIDINLNQIDGLIIPGGILQHLDERLIEIIKYLNKNNRLLAAICISPWILAKAGVLEGVQFTNSIGEWTEDHNHLLHINNPFPKQGYLHKRVVRDENIITAIGSAFIDFTMEVCNYYGIFSDEFQRRKFEKDFKGNDM